MQIHRHIVAAVAMALGHWAAADETTSVPAPQRTWSMQVLHAFQGTDGDCPQGPLVQGPDGRWYGTTRQGGRRGGGTVFRLSADGRVHTLYHFDRLTETSHPTSLSLGPDGWLYGGSAGEYEGATAVMFRINTLGKLQILHRFDTWIHSSEPSFGPDGALYAHGMGSGPWWFGVVYRLTHDDALSVIYTLGTSQHAPQMPKGPPVFGLDGRLYGVAGEGGDSGLGAIYRTDLSGQAEVLYSFQRAQQDGQAPTAGPLLAPDGSLYGTTHYGTPYASGTVWRLDTDGRYSTVHTLAYDGSEGIHPVAGVSMHRKDWMVGATTSEGQGNAGTVVLVHPDGRLKVLHHFAADGLEGRDVHDAPSVGRKGEIVGAACRGGVHGQGTLFQLTPRP